MHHIIADGWSIGVLIREVATLYATLCRAEQSSLAELAIQYADFAVWQREWLQGDVLERQMNYWKEQLKDLPEVLNLPTDWQRPAAQTYQGSTYYFELPGHLTDALNALSQQHDCTLFMTLLAAFQVLLSRLSGQTDIALGAPIANRTRADLEPLIGCFVNTLVLRSDLAGNPPFTQLLARVRATTTAAYAHQDLPFELLVDALQPQRQLSAHPLFQVMCALMHAPLAPLTLPALTLHPLLLPNYTAKFDLDLALLDTPAGLAARLEYATDLFAPATIARLVASWLHLLASIVADPSL